MSRLNDLYKAQIKNSMREKFGYKNDMEIPKLEKIVITFLMVQKKLVSMFGPNPWSRQKKTLEPCLIKPIAI